MRPTAQSGAKRLLVLARYDRLGASSRIRTLQYIPALEAAGFTVEVRSLFDRRYLKALYQGRRAKKEIFRAYSRRFSDLLSRHHADAIWLEKEALPWVPWPIEAALTGSRTPIVADYDDAVFHRYDQSHNPVVRRLLGQKIDRVMQTSAHVFAGNAYLADRAHNAGAKGVSVVPTVVDTQRYGAAEPPTGDVVRVGWIGTPESWNALAAHYLPMLRPAIEHQNGRFCLIGANSGDDPLVEAVEWSEDTEVDALRRLQVGVMPMADTPWTRGKCGYKLLQYMACSLPVVASPVGANKEIVEHGKNGFLAETAEEWRWALQRLLSDANLRRQMGESGRQKVEQNYSLKAMTPFVTETFQNIIGRK